MVKKYAQDMGEKQKRLFNDFVKICIYATDEEFDALLEMRPVDYGMFKSLSEHLIEMGGCILIKKETGNIVMASRLQCLFTKQ